LIHSEFNDVVHLSEIEDRPGWYRLDKVLIYAVFTNGFFVEITVPEGFETDLASVPRLFWSIIPPFGKYNRAAIIHDYMCRRGIDGFLCDAVFRSIMKTLKVPVWQRIVMFYAVRYWNLFMRKKVSK
jgi:hypothetical protein